eukprot:592630-Pyramimonas_sp.AAC.1
MPGDGSRPERSITTRGRSTDDSPATVHYSEDMNKSADLDYSLNIGLDDSRASKRSNSSSDNSVTVKPPP